MKALVLTQERSFPEYLEVSEPTLSEGEVMVSLKAAAMNRRDYWITQGQYPGIKTGTIMGSDGAGLLNGQAVVINPSLNWGPHPNYQASDYTILGMPVNGTFAEKVAVQADRVHPMPSHLSFEQAAALPLGGLTAYRVLFSRCQLQSTDRVLISGIGGGVALLAFQFAVAIGAEVFVTSGQDAKIAEAVKMGAKGGANYKTENWHKQLLAESGGFDVVIDSAGGSGFNNLLKLCLPGARIGIYGGTQGAIPKLSPQLLFWKQISIFGSSMGNDEEFKSMLQFVSDHQLIPYVDSVIPLSESQKGFEHLANGTQLGKVVFDVSA